MKTKLETKNFLNVKLASRDNSKNNNVFYRNNENSKKIFSENMKKYNQIFNTDISKYHNKNNSTTQNRRLSSNEKKKNSIPKIFIITKPINQKEMKDNNQPKELIMRNWGVKFAKNNYNDFDHNFTKKNENEYNYSNNGKYCRRESNKSDLKLEGKESNINSFNSINHNDTNTSNSERDEKKIINDLKNEKSKDLISSITKNFPNGKEAPVKEIKEKGLEKYNTKSKKTNKEKSMKNKEYHMISTKTYIKMNIFKKIHLILFL